MPAMTPNPVYVGMDLGTFKTSVASSAGYRDAVPTAVGWPKDHIARTMLGRDVVFGKDLAEHRLALDVVDAVAIVSEPFTIAYAMNRLSDALVIDIGAGTIDICPIYGVYPSDDEQVTLPMGGDAVDEEFERRLKHKHPHAQVSRNM